MKVAYNSCFGGFGLSPLAETEYQKKKGLTLTWYEGLGDYPHQSYKRVHDLSKASKHAFSMNASNKDLGETISKIPEDNFYYKSWYGDDNRSDPDLIEVIERLGERANGFCAELSIAEIPDGSEFEITEYDGNESVEPPRKSWGE